MKNNVLPHLAARVFDTPLLIDRQKLAVLLEAIGPRIGLSGPITISGLDVAESTITVVPTQAMFDDDYDDDIVESPKDKPYLVTQEGIAVIAIRGTLVRRSSWLDSLSGMMGYEGIRRQCVDAYTDPKIKGIVLDVDSPGGEVGGCFELADDVFAMRSGKPVYAVSNDSAFSAAYALASSAERLFITRTGGVGSVGVVAVHRDQSDFDEKLGMKYTTVTYGAYKAELSTHAPLSDHALGMLQTEINRLGEIFVSTISRNREMKASLVRNTEAGLFFGENAISVGFADQVGTLKDAVAATVEAAKIRKQARVAASAETQIQTGENNMKDNSQADANAAAPTTNDKVPVPAPTQAAQPPVPTQAVQPPVDAAAIEARVRNEIAEITALCGLAGNPSFASKAIADKMTPAAVRDALIAQKSAQSAETATTGNSSAAPARADAQLSSMATQLSASKGITFAQAYTQVVSQNPKLYNQYLSEGSTTRLN